MKIVSLKTCNEKKKLYFIRKHIFGNNVFWIIIWLNWEGKIITILYQKIHSNKLFKHGGNELIIGVVSLDRFSWNLFEVPLLGIGPKSWMIVQLQIVHHIIFWFFVLMTRTASSILTYYFVHSFKSVLSGANNVLWYRSSNVNSFQKRITQCGNYINLLSHFFVKNFVKTTFLLMNLLNS